MHRPETKIEREVYIYATNQAHENQSTREFCENTLFSYTDMGCAVIEVSSF
jgi:hypothetical protein